MGESRSREIGKFLDGLKEKQMKYGKLANEMDFVMWRAVKKMPQKFRCYAAGKRGAFIDAQPFSGVMFCAYCGDVTSYALHKNTRRRPVLDHIVPVAKGGPTTDENLALVCGSCNSSKRHHDFHQWMFRRMARTNGRLSWVNQRA